jgi:hypothetical protein
LRLVHGRDAELAERVDGDRFRALDVPDCNVLHHDSPVSAARDRLY